MDRQDMAADGHGYADGVLVTTSGVLSDEWNNREYKPGDPWAYQPITRPTAPTNHIDITRERPPRRLYTGKADNEGAF